MWNTELILTSDTSRSNWSIALKSVLATSNRHLIEEQWKVYAVLYLKYLIHASKTYLRISEKWPIASFVHDAKSVEMLTNEILNLFNSFSKSVPLTNSTTASKTHPTFSSGWYVRRSNDRLGVDGVADRTFTKITKSIVLPHSFQMEQNKIVSENVQF